MMTTHLVVAVVALVVIGGATRVMEAGLACPDWPLCYGVFLPGRQMNLQVFLEWFHRLDAFLVGVTLLILFGLSVWKRRRLAAWVPWATLVPLLLVALQGALGALTVTHLLAAPTVTAHLATALLLVLVLSGLDQCLAWDARPAQCERWWPLFPILTVGLVFGQCVLGGAMASQWAVDHCFQAAHQCDWVLRHRQFAQPAALSVFALAVATLIRFPSDASSRSLALGAAGVVGLQVLLGCLTLHWQLQKPFLTIGHQLLAALLMACLGALCGRSLLASRQSTPAPSLEITCG
jgi:cytochrome c oxidase assembly protein subunit 15